MTGTPALKTHQYRVARIDESPLPEWLDELA
jgi:hypothetical protein